MHNNLYKYAFLFLDMQKRADFKNLIASLILIKKNLMLYLPDILFYITAVLISFLFLHFNDLNSILSGDVSVFKEQFLNILKDSPSLLKLMGSFLFSVIVSVIVGLGTVTLRFNMISNIIQKKNFTFFQIYMESDRYLLRVFLLKFFFILIYSIPSLIIAFFGLIYKPSFIFISVSVLSLTLFFRLIFLFSYPIAFLNNLNNPITIIVKAVKYFYQNKIHVIITGVIVGLIYLIFSLLFNFLPIFSGDLLFREVSKVIIIFIIIKTLVGITINLWTDLYVFKNY